MLVKNFVKKVQENGNFANEKEAKEAIKIVFESIKESLIKEESISISGFGTFKPSIIKGRTGFIPNSSEKYTTEDKKGVKFLPSKKFKNLLSEN